MMGSDAELGRAQRRLFVAYEQARALSYRAGRAEMRELAAAEQAYQQARLHDHLTRAHDQPS